MVSVLSEDIFPEIAKLRDASHQREVVADRVRTVFPRTSSAGITESHEAMPGTEAPPSNAPSTACLLLFLGASARGFG